MLHDLASLMHINRHGDFPEVLWNLHLIVIPQEPHNLAMRRSAKYRLPTIQISPLSLPTLHIDPRLLVCPPDRTYLTHASVKPVLWNFVR